MHVQYCKMGLFEDPENFSIGAHCVENVNQLIHVLPWPPNERSGTAGNISVCFRNYLLQRHWFCEHHVESGQTPQSNEPEEAQLPHRAAERLPNSGPSRSGDNPFSEMHTCFSQGISPFKSSLEQLPILGFNVEFHWEFPWFFGGCFLLLLKQGAVSRCSTPSMTLHPSPHAENRENVGLHLFSPTKMRLKPKWGRFLAAFAACSGLESGMIFQFPSPGLDLEAEAN